MSVLYLAIFIGIIAYALDNDCKCEQTEENDYHNLWYINSDGVLIDVY